MMLGKACYCNQSDQLVRYDRLVYNPPLRLPRDDLTRWSWMITVPTSLGCGWPYYYVRTSTFS